MRKIFTLILVFMLFPTANSTKLGDDEINYNYFQGLINEGHNSLYNITHNKKGELISANVFETTKNLKEYNIDHKLLEIAPAFKNFQEAVNNITLNYNRMIDHRGVNYSQDYLIFKVSLNDLLRNIAILRRSLDEIDNITLKDKKGRELKFNTTEIKGDIDKLLKNTEKYSNKLNYIKSEGFSIYANKNTTYINSKITIYGYINYKYNLTSIILFHNNEYHILKVKNNSFSKEIYIKTLGDHKFYGVSPFGFSNNIVVRSLKIPTYIETYPDNNIVAYMGEEINIEIYLYDYYGNQLKNSTVYVSYPNGEYKEYKTPVDLEIIMDPKKSEREYKGTRISIIYKGDNTYNASKKTISIDVLKIPTYITANYDSGHITGKLFDHKNNPLTNKTIYLTVNNITYNTTTENGSFRFDLPYYTFENGNITFKGDSIYAPSSKELFINEILAIFGEYSNGSIFLILLITSSIVIFTVFKAYFKRHRFEDKINVEKNEHKNIENITNKVKMEIYPKFERLVKNKKFKESIILAYSLLMNTSDIKKSYTPREICRIHRNEPGIKTITEIFERIYYGDMPPRMEDIEEYIKFFKEK